jgi:hypothetical protein
MDFEFAVGLGVGVELAEEAEDLIGFEVDAFDLVVLAATLDGGPFDDVGGGGTEVAPKGKTPNSNIQAPERLQASSSNLQTSFLTANGREFTRIGSRERTQRAQNQTTDESADQSGTSMC